MDSYEQGRKWLRTKGLRRKLMAVILLLLLLAMGLGTWVLEGWLGGSVLRFGLYWGGVFIYTLVLFILCIYDMAMVGRGR